METHFVFLQITTAAPFDETIFVPMNLKTKLLMLKPNCSVADQSRGAFKKHELISAIPFIPNINIMCNIIYLGRG